MIQRKNRKSNYVSFSRNMTAAALRNNREWKYGVILDGTKLSNKYHIEPFSYARSPKNNPGFRIKELVRYNDGSCLLRLVNWTSIPISIRLFEYLEDQIMNRSDVFNQSHKLEIQTEGKRRINGKLIDTKYTYNVRHGDSGKILSDVDSLPDELRHVLFKGPSTNEYEERIWTVQNYTNIKGCVLGIILPEKELSDFETSDNKLVTLIRNTLDEVVGTYDIIYY